MSLDKARNHTYNGVTGRVEKVPPVPAWVLHEQAHNTTTVNSTCSDRQREAAVAWGCRVDPQAAGRVEPTCYGASDGPRLDAFAPNVHTGCGAEPLVRPAIQHHASDFSGPPSSQWWPAVFPVAVRSISTQARDTLQSGETRVRELARFDRAIDLVVGDSLVALVVPEIGNGPFHAVVNHLPGPESPWQIDDGGLTCGRWRVVITPETVIWDPHPQWASIVIQPQGVQVIENTVLDAGRRGSRSATQEVLARALEERIQGLGRAIGDGSLASIEQVTKSLAGLGPGLTPYGDDVLAGAVLALWAAHHPRCSEIGATVARTAIPATHMLSGAFIEAASRGLASADWHVLLNALSSGSVQAIDHAARRIATTGDTSGVAMLRGFITGYRAARRDN